MKHKEIPTGFELMVQRDILSSFDRNSQSRGEENTHSSAEDE